jgi:PleD family two-component response regulator
VSAGIVSIHDPEDLPTMLKRADSALYGAKRTGRDRTLSWPLAPEPRGALQPGDPVAA